MDKIRTKDILKSIKDYSTVIDNDWLNRLTKQGIVCTEPFYMTKNAMTKKHLLCLWVSERCNTLILLQGWNLKSIIGRNHCWAIVKWYMNKARHPIYHKKKGLRCWEVDKKFRYTKYVWEKEVTLILWEQLDVWYTLKKNWTPLLKFDGIVDFNIDFNLEVSFDIWRW